MATDGSGREVDAGQHEGAAIEIKALHQPAITESFFDASLPMIVPNPMPIYLWGDCMDDEWVELEPTRVSQEAACMIMEERDRWFDKGGAGNLEACLGALGIEAKHRQVYGTSRKTRFMARGHQIFRMDDDTHMDAEERKVRTEELIGAVRNKASETMLVIADYGKGGVLTPDDAEALEQVLALHWDTVVFDPHPANMKLAETVLYNSLAKRVIIKANLSEFIEMDPDARDWYESAGLSTIAMRVAEKRPHRGRVHWIVTCGRRGVVLAPADGGDVCYARGFPCRVVHSIGAGDAFMAGLCTMLAHYHPLAIATHFAHLVAQASVEMPYCGRPTLSDVIAYDTWRRHKE